MKRTTWDPLYDIHDDAQAKKKGIVNRLVYLTMGDLKRAFITWAGEVREVKEADKCRRVLFLMDSLNLAVRENVALVFDQRDNRIKEKAIIKMIGNHQNLLRDAFNNWRKDA